MKAVLKNGEETDLRMETRYEHFYAMSANGIMRTPMRDNLKEIDLSIAPKEKKGV